MASPRSSMPRRASMQQPPHRRPFYGKTPKSFDTYVSDNRRRSSTQKSFASDGIEIFSYDPDHLSPFEMPSGLSQMLPDELRKEAQVWQEAAAALETGLQRIDVLYQEATTCAFPKRAARAMERSVSDAQVPVLRSVTPPSLATPSTKLTLATSSIETYGIIPGLDSPPLTPTISNTSTGLSIPDETAILEKDDSSVMLSMTGCSMDETHLDDFDEISWELYLRRYQATLADCQEASRRMNGYGRKINTLCAELSHEGVTTGQQYLLNFTKWWGVMERVLVKELDLRVSRLDTPDIDSLRMECEASRKL